MIEVPPPHPSDLGRLNVSNVAPPPLMHCRWCLEPLLVRRAVVHCGDCDGIPPLTAARP